MPPIKSSASKCCALLTASISLNGEIISPYSRYTKKGLVYIAIINPSGRQLSLYAKCTKSNPHILYNVRLVLLNKYTFPTYFNIY